MEKSRIAAALSEGTPPYIIAEAGVNHDGNVGDAHLLIEMAADCRADAVKFQTFDPAALVSEHARPARYQRRQTNVETQRELLERFVLPLDSWSELADHARALGLDFLSTAVDTSSLLLLRDVGVPALKLGSGELTNEPLLRETAAQGLPVICSTGMGDLAEVSRAVEWLSEAPSLMLLHCVSAYPAPIAQCNLRAIGTMQREFGYPVGWSDHTIGAVSAVAAIAQGATALEKHITLDKTRPGPDHAASAEHDDFAAYVQSAHEAFLSLGDGIKAPTADEEETIPLVRRSWHLRRAVPAGMVLTSDDLALLRPADGLSPSAAVVGRAVARNLEAGEPLGIRDLAP